jgi:hypothetical protein
MPADVWPTAGDELVLAAALASGPGAREAWTRCQALPGAAENSPQGWHQLWPLVYHNLRAQGVPREELAFLRERAVAALVANTRLLADLDETLALLHEAGIDTLVFKGVALTGMFYRDWSARTIGDFDVLVPAGTFDRAVTVLTDSGRLPLDPPDAVLDGTQPGLNFVRPDGRPDVDLHVHLFHADCGTASEQRHWDESTPLRIGRSDTRTLCATDHLLHVCTHGLIFGAERDLRWIADGVTILRDPRTAVDWERLVRVASDRQLTRQMAAALGYLRRTFEPSIPSAALLQIERHRPDWASRTLARTLMRADRQSGHRWWVYRWATLLKASGTSHPLVIGRLAWIALRRKYRGRSPWAIPFLLIADHARRRVTRSTS